MEGLDTLSFQLLSQFAIWIVTAWHVFISACVKIELFKPNCISVYNFGEVVLE